MIKLKLLFFLVVVGYMWNRQNQTLQSNIFVKTKKFKKLFRPAKFIIEYQPFSVQFKANGIRKAQFKVFAYTYTL